jgi:hypothetical protein
MTEDKRDIFFVAKISQPVPGEHALGTDDQIVPVRMNGLQKGVRLGFDVAVEQCLSLLVENTQVHFVGVQVDSTVMLVLFGVQSHEKASFAYDDLRLLSHYNGSGPLGAKGVFSIIKSINLTGNSRVLKEGNVPAGRLFHR